jgi:hypothetical protein
MGFSMCPHAPTHSVASAFHRLGHLFMSPSPLVHRFYIEGAMSELCTGLPGALVVMFARRVLSGRLGRVRFFTVLRVRPCVAQLARVGALSVWAQPAASRSLPPSHALRAEAGTCEVEVVSAAQEAEDDRRRRYADCARRSGCGVAFVKW